MAKYLKKFETTSDYYVYIYNNPELPNVSICADDENTVYYNLIGIPIPTDEIWYISQDGSVVTPYSTTGFGANIISNTYQDGKGVIKFDGPVTSIGDMAFFICSGLIFIKIPDSVTTIGNDAFRYCESLTDITIPENVTSIGDEAFYNCSGLESITVNNNNSVYDSRNNCNALIETNTNKLIAGCKNTIIPNTVTSIGNNAFYYCSSLTSITISDSVTNIGNSAFNGCSSLTDITIPSGVTSIGNQAFSNCNALESITVNNSNTVYDSRNNCNALIETSTNKLIQGCKNTIIPNTVTSIDDSAFQGCGNLTGITIPNSVTSIGNWAFYQCSGLTSITIPNSVTSISEGAFEACTSLTDITISDSVTSIGNRAFNSCSSLIGITVEATTPPTIGSSGVFYDTNNCPIYVPEESVDAYKTAIYWSTYADRIQARP